jgi:outer membrane protein assembly factor BamA
MKIGDFLVDTYGQVGCIVSISETTETTLRFRETCFWSGQTVVRGFLDAPFTGPPSFFNRKVSPLYAVLKGFPLTFELPHTPE